MKTGILVSSCKDYNLAIMNLLPSLKFSPRNLIVTGGYKESKEYKINDITTIGVTHNSFDFTGLIEIVSNPHLISDWTHVLTVHDTMEIGEYTLDLCQLANPDVDATAANGGLTNLVLYKKEYLFSIKDLICEYKNRSKTEYVQSEGRFFHIAKNKEDFPVTGVANLGTGFPFSKVERIKEYYYALDIIKWKANYTWSRPWINEA